MENVFKEAYNVLQVKNRGWRRSNLERRTVRMRLRSMLKCKSGRYPEEATKVEKGVIWKQAKKFLLVDGVLHYKKSVKGGEQRLQQVESTC